MTATTLAMAWIAFPLPQTLLDTDPASSVTLTDRNGTELRTTRASNGARLRWVSLAEIDADLIAAFLATEDRRFYEHGGIDARAVLRAVRDNARAGRVVSGASTITMQTARLLHGMDRGWWGKIRQGLWALKLEAHWE